MTAATARLDRLMKLLEAEPNDPFVLYGIAQEHARNGPSGHERAIEFYDRCLAADPRYCYAYYHKAVSLIALNRKDEAAQTLELGIAEARAARDEKAMSEMNNLLQTLQ